MGHGPSLHVSNQQALSLFEPQELLTFTRSFKRIASPNHSKEVDRKLLATTLQGATNGFITRLWAVLTTLSSPAQACPTYEGFICAAALCCKMQASNRGQFLFHLMDIDGDGKLSREDMQHSLKEIGLSSLRMYDVDVLAANPKKRRDEAEKDVDVIATSATNAAFEALVGKDHAHIPVDKFIEFAAANRALTEFLNYMFQRFYNPEAPVPTVLQCMQILVPMQRLGDTDLLTDELNLSIKDQLPSHLCNHALTLLYSTRQHGFAFSTVLMRQGRKEITKYFEPSTILICRDANDNICGGYASEFWRRLSSSSFGDSSCFVFQVLNGSFHAYRATSVGNYLYSDHSGLAFGGQPGYHALFLDGDFVEGKSEPTATFGNPRLVPESPFRIQTIEVWGFVDKRKLQRDMEEKEAQSKSVLEGREATFILDLLGKNYSEGER